MKVFIRNNIHVLSLLAAITTPTTWANELSKNSPAAIQRSFVNPGFEDLTGFGTRNTLEYGCYWQNGSWTSSYCIFGESTLKVGNVIKGWRTTTRPDHPSSMPGRREIELWKAGNGIDANNTGMTAPVGSTIYAELNAHESAALYQNLCISNQDEFTWSLQHAQRVDPNESMSFFITDKITDSVNGKLPEGTRKIVLKDDSDKSVFGSSPIREWRTYQRTTFDKGLTSQLPAEPTIMSFVFQAEEASLEERGNWLDNIKMRFKPAVEIMTKDNSFVENSNGIQPITFKIVGLIESADQMPTLEFKIDYDDPKFIEDNGYVPPEHRLNYNDDYIIYEKVNAETDLPLSPSQIQIDEESGSVKFSYKPPFDSAVDYAQGVDITGLAIKVINNSKLNGDRVLPVSFNLDAQSPVIAMSTSSCGNAPLESFTLKVIEDDVDLAVKKTMLKEQSTFVTNDLRVSYAIDVSNDVPDNIANRSNFIAKQVFLRDELFTNLEWDTKTTLTCTAESENAVCPTLPQDALQQFFSTGLNLGDLKANAKLKFTVSNLKVKSKDDGMPGYEGLVVNRVEVFSNASNDINPENNKAFASTMYPTKNDLMNGHAELTGQGLFVIEKDGNALWTQQSQGNKVYFPLKIKNESSISQDYQLYASPSEIQPTFPNQELSSLKQETISAYTEKLNIEFYQVVEGQCNANIPAARPITRVNVLGNKTGEVCAVISVSPSADPEHDIWFAIESLQTGLGDIIRDKVIYNAPTSRQLVLVNDQQAQINVGGTYVFAHRLSNEGSVEETNLQFALKPLSPQDDFSYTLFIDHNNNGILDTGDEQVQPTTVVPNLDIGDDLALLVKVQAPSTATNGMQSQVEIIVTPKQKINDISLESLTNTDMVKVGSDQLVLQKTQFKQESCSDMTAAQIKAAQFSLSQMSIGRNDCIIYRIEATNIGTEKLTSIIINDMYPHYSTPWLSNGVLPMTDSGDVVNKQNDKVDTKITELLPGEKKSLYFGIRLQ